MQRPLGVSVIAILFFLAGAYLWAIGILMLFVPGTVSMMSGSQFMYGSELAGPYMALLVGSGWALVGWGLLRLHHWARWAMVLAVVSLVPQISMAELGVPVIWYGLHIALRVAVGWYLAQAPAVVDAFSAKQKNT
jgi:hypothetical protein